MYTHAFCAKAYRSRLLKSTCYVETEDAVVCEDVECAM